MQIDRACRSECHYQVIWLSHLEGELPMSIFVGLFSWTGRFSREDSPGLLSGAQNPHCQQIECPVSGVL